MHCTPATCSEYKFMSYVLCLCLGHEGAHDYVGIIVYDYSYGVSLPHSEHVDIFPVRLCLHSH